MKDDLDLSDDTTQDVVEEEEQQEEQEEETEQSTGRKGRKKSSRAKSASSSKRQSAPKQNIKEVVRCGGCGNIMMQSDGMNWTEIKGKKVPKNDEGEYLYSTPEMAEGKVGTALCSDCKAREAAGNAGFHVNTAVIERDGKYSNVLLSDIPGKTE